MRSIVVFASVVCTAVRVSSQPIIITAAGTDLVFKSNGQSAVNAPLGRISQVAIDPDGRPVFADPNYHLVLRVEAGGTLTVIAGNNVQGMRNNGSSLNAISGGGYSGDEGPATSAALNRPVGVAYDPAGNLYIADVANQRIRQVTTDGIIHTFAGTGQAGFQGDGGQARVASLNFPTIVTVDRSGNVYLYDSQNVRIRKITPQGVISSIAGNGKGGVSGENVPAVSSPIDSDVEGLALDAQGNLYFSEFDNARVRRISNGTLTTVAGTGTSGFTGDGPATLVELNYPTGLAFDQSGNLFISDANNARIRKLTNGVLTTIAGNGQSGIGGDNGQAQGATLHNPWGLAVTSGGVLNLADRDNFRLRQINTQGVISTIAGNGQLLSSQNGMQAPLITLLDPFGVSFDAHGSMLIADTDNDVLRKGTNGTFSIVAGTGAEESSGDNGPALQAGLLTPWSVSADAQGNLYETETTAVPGVVRKIGLAGSISTIAGANNQSPLRNPVQAVTDSNGNTYIADLSESNILVRSASGNFTTIPGPFANPGGLALDQLGNLYVTEWGAGRVKRVTPSGNVTTIAGGGKAAGTAADGGPATNAQLGQPAGVVVDGAGNVYFTDSQNASVRKIATDGTISTLVGNGRQGFSGDGGPATSASLNVPWGLTLDSTGSLYIADAGNNRIREVLINSQPGFSSSTSSIALSAVADGKQTDPAGFTISSSLNGLLYTASANQPWLQVTPATGAMPASLQVVADPTGLAPGAYSGKISVSAPGANPNIETITVAFAVGAPQPAVLTSDVPALSLSFVAGAAAVSQSVTVRNTGSGTLNFSVSASMTNGSGWLSVSPSSDSVTPNSPASLTVTISPSGLAPGTYSGQLTFSGGTVTVPLSVPVTVSVSAALSKLQLSASGFTIPAVSGGGPPLPRSFGVLNAGQGSMTWSAAVTAGASWLTAGPLNGVVTTPTVDISEVTVMVDPSGLIAGTYYGKIDVTASGNQVQSVIITLNVAPSGSPAAALDVYPNALVFTGSADANPGSQTVSIANLATQPVGYTSSRIFRSGAPWFVHVPSNGTIAPGQLATIVVQPDFTNLSAGTYQGSITFQIGNGTATIQILGIVTSSGTGAGGAMEIADSSTICNTLLVSPSTLNVPSAAVTLGQPQSLDVLVTYSCSGAPMTSGSVTANFSNHDPVANLTHVGNGRWTGTWTPRTPSLTGVSITLLALTEQGITPYAGDTTLTVSVLGGSTPVTSGALNAASGAGKYIAPGGLVSIYGQQLATGSSTSGSPPFPTQINGTQVLMGGIALPLRYVAPGQVNAQVPFGLAENSQQQLIVVNGGAYSSQDVLVASAQPGVYTQDGSGMGAGIIYDFTNQNTEVTSSNPAQAGDIVVIYCNGLGAVNPAVPTGTPAPLSGPLSTTKNPVTVTIDGSSATVLFAGLTPGYPDLYQVNAVVPNNLVRVGQLPVILTVAGQSSPPVTLAVQ